MSGIQETVACPQCGAAVRRSAFANRKGFQVVCENCKATVQVNETDGGKLSASTVTPGGKK